MKSPEEPDDMVSELRSEFIDFSFVAEGYRRSRGNPLVYQEGDVLVDGSDESLGDSRVTDEEAAAFFRNSEKPFVFSSELVELMHGRQ